MAPPQVLVVPLLRDLVLVSMEQRTKSWEMPTDPTDPSPLMTMRGVTNTPQEYMNDSLDSMPCVSFS